MTKPTTRDGRASLVTRIEEIVVRAKDRHWSIQVRHQGCVVLTHPSSQDELLTPSVVMGASLYTEPKYTSLRELMISYDPVAGTVSTVLATKGSTPWGGRRSERVRPSTVLALMDQWDEETGR